MPAPHDHPPTTSPLVARTLEYIAHQNQSDFDIEFFRAVLDRAPENLDVLRCQAELLTRMGRHREAIRLDHRLARLLPGDGIVHYNFACSLALLDRHDEAVERLRYAFSHGYDDYEHMLHDCDLEALHDMPRYQALLREYCIV